MTAIEARALRDAFGAFLTGVTVVTTHDDTGSPIGFTANSFTSVSLDPPLLLVCLARTSRNFETLTKAPGFAVNILSETQKDVSNTFARPVEDRFSAVEWRKGPHGSPVFADVAAWFDCASDSIVDGGDHVILIGRIEAFENGKANGLGYVRGSYFTPELAQKAVSAAAGRRSHGRRRRGARRANPVDQGRGRPLRTADLRPGTRRELGGVGLERWRNAQACRPASASSIRSTRTVRTARATSSIAASSVRATPARARSSRLDALPLDNLVDSATRDILRRYAAESALGNFGMYVGDERSGRVHAVSGDKRP